METIHFRTTVDEDQVIRPPTGVTLPRGEIEVIVRARPEEPGLPVDALTRTRDWLLALAADAEANGPDLPSDLARHHDHYAHGKPLP